MPNNLKQLDSDVIIHKFGEIVNPQNEKSSGISESDGNQGGTVRFSLAYNAEELAVMQERRDKIVPEIRELKKKVALGTKEKSRGLEVRDATVSGVAQRSRPATISIAQLAALVNSDEVDFLKYFPKQFAEAQQGVRFSLTPGQTAKFYANNTKNQVFNRESAERAVNRIVDDVFLAGHEELRATVEGGKGAVVDRLWQHLNRVDKKHVGNVVTSERFILISKY